MLDADDHERRDRPNHGSDRRQRETCPRSRPPRPRRTRKSPASEQTRPPGSQNREAPFARPVRREWSKADGDAPKIAPELPTLVEKVPRDPEWLHELKLDGYRVIGFVRDGKASLFTRRGLDWTHRFPAVAGALENLGSGDVIVDGEIVVLGLTGHRTFRRLQNVMRHGDDDVHGLFRV